MIKRMYEQWFEPNSWSVALVNVKENVNIAHMCAACIEDTTHIRVYLAKHHGLMKTFL